RTHPCYTIDSSKQVSRSYKGESPSGVGPGVGRSVGRPVGLPRKYIPGRVGKSGRTVTCH
ncbi:MAG: hypothetical protein KAW13_06790, partial [Dehalococcoidia bacterium]|nr:hypothetical protein [Dehalococcoidia bacterium]